MNRWIPFGICIQMVLSTVPVLAMNEQTTVVLHTQLFDQVIGCDAWIGNVDCSPASPPTVNASAGDQGLVFAFLRNYDEVSSLTCRFAVDGGVGAQTWGDWTFLWAQFSCLTGQTANPPGVTSGNLATTFNCISGGELEVLGFMGFIVGTGGCLNVEDNEFADSGVYDCTVSTLTPIAPQNRGSICIGSGGHNACEPGPVPVESATWGAIKSQYH